MKQIDKLIICSPYDEPNLHWQRDEETQEFYQENGRRPAGYTIANPKSKKGAETGQFIPLELANLIRHRLAEWRKEGRKGLTHVSHELLEFWEDTEARKLRFFFCQIEAMETIMFLNEAPNHYKTGIDIPSDGGEFVRWCNKMATGSGKTTVMAMLVAYQILNKVAYKTDERFTKNILIVAPGLTVKSRLAVLQPADETNYYQAFQIVPTSKMETLRQGQIKIINWHQLAWDTQEKLDKKTEKGYLRSVDKRKHIEISDLAYAKNVLGDMANASNILVINDEAHHAWRNPNAKKSSQRKKDEVDNTIWMGGLDKLSKQVAILRCHDFSATPFAPTGKKASEVGLFDWIISDFGLNDAIEAGLVKTPRVVLRDDGKHTSDYKSRLYHLYLDRDVKEDLNQKQDVDKAPLPDLVKNAYNLLGQDWLRTKQEWRKNDIGVTPVMITIANTTTTSNRIKHYFDSGNCEIQELCAKEKTLQIDSKILGQIENDDEGLTGSKKKIAEELREKIDTVGKVGKAGEHIQNVISVNMLSEGWDAKNVTQIMGLRAFSSQLLCEQVIGRGLRRVSYEFDENLMLAPEYVNIFGVPFSFIPHEGGVSTPRPPKPSFQIEASQEKSDYEISFPNVLRIDTEYNTTLELDFDQIKPIEINPEDTITKAELGSVINNDITPSALRDIDLEEYNDRYRLQAVIYKMASSIVTQHRKNWTGNQADFFAQLLQLTEAFLKSDRIQIKSNLFSRDEIRRNILLTLNMSRIIQHFATEITNQNAKVLHPVLDNEKPLRSTSDMPTWYTSKPNAWHEKSHINFTVYDSTWEANSAKIINQHQAVKAFAKNDHLGFLVRYHYRGVLKNFVPDYLIQLQNGDKLILEIKGQDSDENRVKREYLNLWVKAVNQTKEHGKWYWAVAFNSFEIYDILDAYQAFPITAHLPEKQYISEEQIQEQGQDLATFYEISVDALKGAKSLPEMLKIVMKDLLSTNLDKILTAFREASTDLDDADDELQNKIYHYLDGITPPEPKNYESRIRSWLPNVSKLKRQSFSYLISGEYIYDTLVQQRANDFSPYVLQISRAVESELLLRIFIPFTNLMRSEHRDLKYRYAEDLDDFNTKTFARNVVKNHKNYTIGEMNFILSKMMDRELLDESELMQDFRDFVLDSDYSEDLYGRQFVKNIQSLTTKYRNKSAHTGGLITREESLGCKRLVKGILSQFLEIMGG